MHRKVRKLYLHALGLLLCVAWLVSFFQNEELIGTHGLTPANASIMKWKENGRTFMDSPTIFWFIAPSNQILSMVAIIGLIIAIYIAKTGRANLILIFMTWCLYTSIVNVGGTWFSFGWESQLLETLFLTMFIVPFFDLYRTQRNNKEEEEEEEVSRIGVWSFRWLIFRIMIGAGLIKIRGDPCWTTMDAEKTCMAYHYETQPVPSPLSSYFHYNPPFIHLIETMGNHVIELVLPWFTFLPRNWRVFNGFSQIFFQFVLILSGNLSFLNWLTILPSFWLFDDQALTFGTTEKKNDGDKNNIKKNEDVKGLGNWTVHRIIRILFNIFLAFMQIYMSIPVVQNLLSSRQMMNTSFDPFRLLNTYGAFGSITKTRTEVIMQATLVSDPYSTVGEISADWIDIEFKCKPGNIDRQPCWLSPYHYRLDWLAWFAGFQTYQHQPWLVNLAVKLTKGESSAFALLDGSSNQLFKGGGGENNITFVRAMKYEYKMQPVIGDPIIDTDVAWQHGRYWRRRLIGEYMPAINGENPSVKEFLKAHGWS
jgi:lipase maturation factor 1